MEEQTLTWPILLGGFVVFQVILGVWSWLKTRSVMISTLSLLFPLAGLPLTLWRLRDTAKDNQVGGAVTYLAAIVGIAFFLDWNWLHPEDFDIPWFVIFTIEFFAGVGLLNVINLSVEMRIRGDGS